MKFIIKPTTKRVEGYCNCGNCGNCKNCGKVLANGRTCTTNTFCIN